MNPIAIANQFQNHMNPFPSLQFPMSMAIPQFRQNLQPLFDEVIPLTIQAPAAIPSLCVNYNYLNRFKVFREEGQCLKDMHQYLAETHIEHKEELQAVKAFDTSLIEKALLHKDFKMLAILCRQGLSIPADTLVSESFIINMALALSENKNDDVKDFLSTIEINIKNKNGETLLITASEKGLSKLVSILVAVPGINPNTQDKKGNTALIKATYGRNAEIIKILLDHPTINPNVNNNKDFTALIIAILDCNDIIARMFAAHPQLDPNILYSGFAPLTLAISKNQTEIVKALLANTKTNPNAREREGTPALIIASILNDTETVNLLLTHPLIDLNAQSNNGHTAFLEASSKGHTSIMNSLKLSGKDTVSEDIKYFKILGHSWELQGKIKFRDFNIELEGFAPIYAAEFMDSTLNAFQKRYPDLIQNKLTDQISHGFSHAKSFNAKQALHDYKNGKPIFIPTGSKNHIITVVIHNSYLMICNKGTGSLRPIEAYKIDPRLLTEEMITMIKECIDETLEEGFEALFGERYSYSDDVIRLNGPLLQRLRIHGDTSADEADGFALWLEHILLHNSKKQAVGNCAWESLETAVYATIALQLAIDGNFEFTKDKMVGLTQKSHAIFSGWEKFTKLEAVIQSLNRIQHNILTSPETKDSMRSAFGFIDQVYKEDAGFDFWDSRHVIKTKTQDIKVLMDGEGWMSMLEWIPYKLSKWFNSDKV